MATKNIILTADNISEEGNLEIVKEIYLKQSTSLEDTKKLRAGDCFICFSSGSRKHVGKLAYIKEDLEYYAGGFMGILRPKDSQREVLPKYVAELLKTEGYRDRVREMSAGANINNLSNSIGSIKLLVPSLSEQERIVSEIEGYEAEIAKAQAVMDSCASRKAELVQKTLY